MFMGLLPTVYSSFRLFYARRDVRPQHRPADPIIVHQRSAICNMDRLKPFCGSAEPTPDSRINEVIPMEGCPGADRPMALGLRPAAGGPKGYRLPRG